MQFVTLKSDAGLKLSLCDYGARIVGIEVPYLGKTTQLALAYKKPEEYLQDEIYLGATIGPIANRLAGGKMIIDEKEIRLTTNEGNNCLHGGARSFDRMLWQVAEQSSRHITFSLEYPELAGSVPGNLQLTATYSVSDRQIEIDYRATTDRATYLNLTNHVYLNLNGDSETVHNHQFRFFADGFAEKQVDGLPTGRIIRIDQPFNYSLLENCPNTDLRSSLDHHFIVDESSDKLKPLAQIRSSQSNISVDVASTKPGFQAYTAHAMAKPFTPFGAFCIEPQYAPNAINQTEFISPLTTPDSPYNHHHTFSFDWPA